MILSEVSLYLNIGGISRVLDAGQCNDSYSLAVIAMKLRDAFRLGPTLPAFISPTVLNVLVDKFDIKAITTSEEDIAAMMAGN